MFLEESKAFYITTQMLEDAVEERKKIINPYIKISHPILSAIEIAKALTFVITSPNASTLIKMAHTIEWTPDKLYLEGYYLVRLKDSFWIVKHTFADGLVANFYTCIKDMLQNKIKRLYYNIYEQNIPVPPNHLPNGQELNVTAVLLDNSTNGTYYLVKYTTPDTSGKRIAHYMMRYMNNVYYIPLHAITNYQAFYVYKSPNVMPIIY